MSIFRWAFSTFAPDSLLTNTSELRNFMETQFWKKQPTGNSFYRVCMICVLLLNVRFVGLVVRNFRIYHYEFISFQIRIITI